MALALLDELSCSKPVVDAARALEAGVAPEAESGSPARDLLDALKREAEAPAAPSR